MDWVNQVFPSVLPAFEDEASGAVAYSASVPFHTPDPEGEPMLHTFSDREAEAHRVAQLVTEARGRTAILVRNRSHLDAIVPALKGAGIRFRAVEIEQLGEKQVVQDLYALTRALTHLADRVAWLAILRAPWCGLTLAELSEFFEGKAELTIWELMQGKPRFERIAEILGPALENRLRGTLRDRVEGAWLALGGPACVEDATDLEDAEIFFAELERLEEAGELEDFALLAESLGKLYAEPDVEAGPEAVEIMTIHKAKGLEFDTVIVPGLDRPPRSGMKPLFAWRSLPGGGLLIAPVDETGGEKEPLYQYVRQLDREAEDIEAGRLFYVAATRAESRLHLLGVREGGRGRRGEDAFAALAARIGLGGVGRAGEVACGGGEGVGGGGVAAGGGVEAACLQISRCLRRPIPQFGNRRKRDEKRKRRRSIGRRRLFAMRGRWCMRGCSASPRTRCAAGTRSASMGCAADSRATFSAAACRPRKWIAPRGSSSRR